MALFSKTSMSVCVLRGLLAALVGCISVNAFAQDSGPTVSFVNDVMPVFTKAGCNTGACHAKAGGGQNGFQLSLLGFEPAEDFESLTKEARGRRLFPAVPERSLVLMKASNQTPHGGGMRLSQGSPGYLQILEWI